MDQLDYDIISHLRGDGRKPFTEIAESLDVSEGTIRNRVSKLIEDNVIQIVGLADPYKLGQDAPAMIGITVRPQIMEEVAAQLVLHKEVSYLVAVSGEFDLLVEVMCKDRNHLNFFLNETVRKINGVTSTKTFFILHTYKMAYGAVPEIAPNE
ncbi:MAG: Lrp/AsnC family transcriptional regulator [Anaerolineae bacterium]|nr:Lrp/AsnC family transcriptional regulator [Anaerolineae bacterium]